MNDWIYMGEVDSYQDATFGSCRLRYAYGSALDLSEISVHLPGLILLGVLGVKRFS